MGEEEKKPEEKKPEEPKAAEGKKEEVAAKPADEKKTEEPKAEEQPAPPPPPPQEIVLKVYMHCEGCARKVRRCLKGFDGVEDVITDCKTSKVVVKGEKADPLKVLGRIQRKSHRQVELISPIPPQPEEPKKAEEKPLPKPEEKKELPVITVVLGVYMHCEACALEIKKRILKMKGVESVVPDLKSSQVTVKGVFSPENLTEYVHKRTGKHAVVVKVEPEKKEEEKTKEKKKPEEPEKEAKKDDSVKDTASAAAGGEAAAKAVGEVAEDPKLELKKNEFLIYYPHHENLQTFYPPPRIVQEYYQHEYHQHEYPPQIFSDENPNACSVM